MDHHLLPSEPPSEPPGPPPEPYLAASSAAGPPHPVNEEWFVPRGDRTEPDDGATHDGSPRPRSAMTWVAAGISAAVIAAAAVIGIHSATSHAASTATAGTGASSSASGTGTGTGSGGPGGFGRDGDGTFGAITAIDGSTLTVQGRSGTSTTVKTTSSTVVSTTATGTVADISTGDHLVVIGTTSGSTVAATAISDRGTATDTFGGPAGGAPPGGAGFGGVAPVMGAVTAIDGSSITLKGSDGTTMKVTTSPATTVEIEKTIPVSQLKTGETVVVTGATSNGVVTATRIREGTGGFGGPGGFRRGSFGGSSTNPAPGS